MELAPQLDDCYDELLASGATEQEAYRAALAERQYWRSVNIWEKSYVLSDLW